MKFGAFELILVLLIVLVIFGAKKLLSGAKDAGKAVKEFKKGIAETKKTTKKKASKKKKTSKKK